MCLLKHLPRKGKKNLSVASAAACAAVDQHTQRLYLELSSSESWTASLAAARRRLGRGARPLELSNDAQNNEAVTQEHRADL